MLPPFQNPSWRGCVVDRDLYGWERMPRELFDAVIAASGTNEITVCGYAEVGKRDPIATISASWKEFGVFMAENYTTECVIFSPSRDWAILGDFDVTVLGAYPDIADRIDGQLASLRTSLEELSRPMFSGENEVVVNYFKAIAGVL